MSGRGRSGDSATRGAITERWSLLSSPEPVKPSQLAKPDFSLVRVAVRFDGAFGVLLEGTQPFAVTIERTYGLAGGAQIVKIPAGVYRCERTYFEHGGYPTFEILGVIGHSRLLFHVANSETDLEGCVGLGQLFSGRAEEATCVINSKLAFAEFMRRTAGRLSFTLEVRQA